MNLAILGLPWIFWAAFWLGAAVFLALSLIPRLESPLKNRARASAIVLACGPFVLALALLVRSLN